MIDMTSSRTPRAPSTGMSLQRAPADTMCYLDVITYRQCFAKTCSYYRRQSWFLRNETIILSTRCLLSLAKIWRHDLLIWQDTCSTKKKFANESYPNIQLIKRSSRRRSFCMNETGSYTSSTKPRLKLAIIQID